MTNTRDWEKGGPKLDCRGVEMTHHYNRKGKLAIAVVTLLALMLPNHEALARGDGGFGGGHEGSFGAGGSHGSAFGGGFGFRGGDNRLGGFGGRGFSHLAVGREFDHRGQVGDPYWTPCNYYSYADDSCGD
jgi:uncharacterized membrane protein